MTVGRRGEGGVKNDQGVHDSVRMGLMGGSVGKLGFLTGCFLPTEGMNDGRGTSKYESHGHIHSMAYK